MTITHIHTHILLLLKGKIGRSIELNMAFFDMFNSTEPVVPKYPIR